MFCLDYAIAFTSHYWLSNLITRRNINDAKNKITISYDTASTSNVKNIAPSSATSTTTPSMKNHMNTPLHFVLGATSGLIAAITLYPFDFVRMNTTASTTLWSSSSTKLTHFALSTIPYMSFYMGIYFSRPRQQQTTKEPFQSKALWALIASTSASFVELPFDKSKHEMLGSFRNAALVASIRVPFGALLLLGYDQIRESAPQS